MNDAELIAAAALDYFEGWFDGDPVRMERALHPELAKRPGRRDDAAGGALRTLTAREMIDPTAEASGAYAMSRTGRSRSTSSTSSATSPA